MANQRRAVLYAAGWALLLGACGPALDGEDGEYAEPPAAESPAHDDAVTEEDNEVSQATFGGHIGSALGSPVKDFNSCTANNEWRTTCGSGAAPDMSYHWTVPVTGDYTFSTVGSTYDTVLEIRRRGDTAIVLGCNDDRADGVPTSRVTLRGLTKGIQLLIIVDGYGSSVCGAGKLNINGL
ncbi:hypothetical protein [Myxococcus sp. CA039A]|uniref:hypothetical protein n=1 Tax=Myxococcus sp. CA039A TaxID=2741737 RepID=UPI00157B1583|nr:hypothetical protein [Myxococcus sp. CA039A]NTX54628.1 hypothetical protein [Myxococcus sp. CA039A]